MAPAPQAPPQHSAQQPSKPRGRCQPQPGGGGDRHVTATPLGDPPFRHSYGGYNSGHGATIAASVFLQQCPPKSPSEREQVLCRVTETSPPTDAFL